MHTNSVQECVPLTIELKVPVWVDNELKCLPVGPIEPTACKRKKYFLLNVTIAKTNPKLK